MKHALIKLHFKTFELNNVLTHKVGLMLYFQEDKDIVQGKLKAPNAVMLS